MASGLTICQVAVGGTAAEGNNAAVPAANYYFLTTKGVYIGDIATASGITASSEADDFEDEIIVPIKELIRQGVLVTKTVEVETSTGKTYRKILHISADKYSTFDAAIVGKTWPIGAAAQGTINTVINPRHIRSRQ